MSVQRLNESRSVSIRPLPVSFVPVRERDSSGLVGIAARVRARRTPPRGFRAARTSLLPASGRRGAARDG